MRASRNEILAEEVLDLRKRVQTLGKQAFAAEERSSRTRVYGEILATCAGCHRGGC